MKKILLALVTLAWLSACDNSVALNESYTLPDSLKTKEQLADSSQLNTILPQTVNPETGVVETQPNATVNNNPYAAAKGINPAHGKPGHRCDIPPGAPMNLPPGSTVDKEHLAENKNVKTAPGMNPPHGEPGHRCDLEVGAPLTSAPANTTTAAKVEPVKTVTPPGMNPPHGEPGHVCGIPVGSPLDTTKAKETPAKQDSAKKE